MSDSPVPRDRATWFPFLPAAVIGVLGAAYRYRIGVGEADVMRMLNGILWGHASGRELESGHLYGQAFSFGYYQALYRLPAEVLRDPDRLADWMTWIGVISSTVAVGLLGLLLARVHGTVVSVSTMLLFAFSPMFLELATGGHPLTMALALFSLGALLLVGSAGPFSWRRILLGVAGTAALAVSLTVRAEVLLALPWIVLLSHLPRRRVGDVVFTGLACAVAATGFWVLQAAVVGGGESQLEPLGSFLSAFYSLAKLGYGIGIFLFAAGVVTVGLAGIVLSVALYRKWWRWELAPFLLLLFMNLTFWFPNPAPARHFLFGILGLTGVTALLLAPWIRPRAVLALSIGIVFLNPIAAELLYRPVVEVYPWSYESFTDRRATINVPLGNWPAYHATLQEHNRLYFAEARAVTEIDCDSLVVFGDNLQYLIAAYLGSGEVTEWNTEFEGDLLCERLTLSDRQVTLVGKSQLWPRDAIASYLATTRDTTSCFYEQAYTKTRFDRTPLPPDRTVRVDQFR